MLEGDKTLPLSDDEFHSRFPGLRLKDYVALARAPRLPPEKQWWNLLAKYKRVDQITSEEKARAAADAGANFSSARNTIYDARRHARWSQRMASEVDPITSRVVGDTHEAWNRVEGAAAAIGHRLAPWHWDTLERPAPKVSQTEREIAMDLHNNGVGRNAARTGLPIQDRNLYVLPGPRRIY